jgi:Ca2+-binding EF-hand superfamily protein
MVERMISRFDLDGDGKVMLKDLPGPAGERMKEADKDGDGVLTRQEIDAHFGEGAVPVFGTPGKEGANPKKPGGEGRDFGKMFEKFDANADGKLEGEEIPAKMRDRMDRFDKNKNGVIEKDELLGRMGKRPGGGPEGGRPGPAAMMEQLQMLDVDGDGKVPLADLPEMAQRFAGRLDKDQDGSISMEEIKSGLPTGRPESGLSKLDLTGGPEALFKNFDGNSDGKLSKEELSALPNLPLDRLDQDGDGVLTREELDSQWGKLQSRIEGMRGKKGRAPSEQVGARQLFHSQDADADGRVTKEEAKGTLLERFDVLDSNKDGRLDEQEVEKGFVPAEEAPRPKKNKKPDSAA